MQRLEEETGGKVVKDDRLSAGLERVLRAKKAQNPRMAIKEMECLVFPLEYFVPAEIKLSMLGLEDMPSGFHLFFRCKKVYTVA